MLLVFTPFICILFYIIALRNQQNGAEPACLSVLIFYISLFFGIGVLSRFIIAPLFSNTGMFKSFANLSLFTGLITGVVALFLYYFWLKKNWKEKRIQSSTDILDDEMLD